MASVVKRPASRPGWFWLASLLGCTPGFKKSRCKKLLKVTMSRIKLLRGRREVQVRQLRRDVAQLLQLGQEENAESRLDRLWKEHSLLSAYIKIGEYCQLVKANLRNIAGQRECPMDLKESLASLCFAAACCADLPELQGIRDIMVVKYGKNFLTSAHELLPGEHVNKLFLEAFSTKQPLEVSKKALVKSIVAEYNVVQPKKAKYLGIHGSSQKVALSDCSKVDKQQSRREYGSNSESCKQDLKHNALEQAEKHKNTLEQIKHATSIPTCGAFVEEDTSLLHVHGDRDRKMVGQQKRGQKNSHFQGDMVQEGANKTDHGSQDRHLKALSPDRHGKEKLKNRVKVSKKNARVIQAGQEDQLYSSNRMSSCEKSEPDEAVTEVINGLHVYGNTANWKPSLVKEVKGFVSGQHQLHENGDFYSHTKHRENKPSNKECLADNKHQACIAQPQKHGYHDEALSENCSTHQMSRREKLHYKKNDYADGERSNGAVRPEKVTHAYDNVEHEKEHCHTDFNHVETKRKHHSKSKRKDRFMNEFVNEQQEKSPCRWNRHVEGGTKVDIIHRIDKTSRSREMDYGIDYWQSPLTGNETLPREREPPHVGSNYGDTEHKNNSRSNGKSRPERVTYEPDRVTNELDNTRQESSPCKRNYQVERQTRFERSRRGKESYEIENWQASAKNNGFLPDYGDETHKKQRRKMHSLNKNYENANTMDLSGDHSYTQILQKGREQHHIRKQRLEETQDEAWGDHSERVAPGKGSSSDLHVNDKYRDSKCSERQRDRILQLMENPVAKIETHWDLKEGMQNEAAGKPCIDGKHHPGDPPGHVRHKRPARKHNQDCANSKVKNLDWDAEAKPRRMAEEVVNVQAQRIHHSNGTEICEDGSNYAAQRERAHFPQWHHQFDPIPQGREGSMDVDVKSFPQVVANGMKKEQKHPESLDEHEDMLTKLASCNGVEGNSSSSLSRFSKPPQRPPPPVPPYRVSSMPNRKPLDSPPAMTQRCATLETSHVRANQEPHVHPKLPEYEDLVASFAALRNKPARPPAY